MAQYAIPISANTYPLVFLMVDNTDHVTGKTGLTPTVTLSKNGGSFNSPSGTVAAIANGWYAVSGSTNDTSSLGPLILHATGTSADPTDVMFEIVSYNPQDSVRLGLTALPNAAAAAANGLPTLGTSTGQISVSAGGVLVQYGAAAGQLDAAAGVVKANITQTLGTTSTGQAGSVGIDWAQIVNKTAVVDLTQTIVSRVSGDVGGSVGSVTGAVGSVTGAVLVGSVSAGAITTASFAAGTTIKVDGTSTLTESYAALHSAPTLAQILYEMRSLLAEVGVVTTTLTTKKIDGSTTAETFSLNDASAPTSITRAS